LKESGVKKRIIQKLLLSQPCTIPVFHEVALRLLHMMKDHSYRIEEAIKLVNEDAALASVMLKHANTSFHSGKEPITTIKNAIVRLGSHQVVNLAFTASMATSKSDNPLIHRMLKDLWRHNHIVAITSAWLAVQISHDQKLSDINADEVYLAGLLHEVGKLYLLKSIDGFITSGILQADEKLIGTLLEDLDIPLGIKVMQHWQIPQIYVDSVERHTAEQWQRGSNDLLVAAVRLSCKLHHAIEQGVDVAYPSEAYEHVKDELELLGIDDIASVHDMVLALL